MFFAKKNIGLEDKIKELERGLQSTLLEIEKLKTHIISLRGLVNRKLHNDVEESDTTKDLNNTVLLPDNGIIGKHR